MQALRIEDNGLGVLLRDVIGEGAQGVFQAAGGRRTVSTGYRYRSYGRFLRIELRGLNDLRAVSVMLGAGASGAPARAPEDAAVIDFNDAN